MVMQYLGGGEVNKVHYGLCDYRSHEGNTRRGEEAFSPSFPSCARVLEISPFALEKNKGPLRRLVFVTM